MDWIKVTPETMPPEFDPVFAMIKYTGGETPVVGVWADVRWNNAWGWEYLADRRDIWHPVGFDIEVTHWMPYPEPAED